MIIYQANKRQFLQHVHRDDIEEVVRRHFTHATGHGVGPAEVRAWKHSLFEMAKVLDEDEEKRSKVIIAELKQWHLWGGSG